jgi:hypothetical protein
MGREADAEGPIDAFVVVASDCVEVQNLIERRIVATGLVRPPPAQDAYI